MASARKIYNKGWVIIEIILVVVSIIVSLLLLNNDNLSESITWWSDYLYEVLSNLNDVLLVAIGIYIAVITFLASSKTPFSDKVKTNNLFEKLGSFILIGIINNMFLIIAYTLIIKNFVCIVPLCVIGVFSLIYFGFFIYISYLIYSYNIEQLVIEAEKDDEDKELVITNIERIKNILNDINNKI